MCGRGCFHFGLADDAFGGDVSAVQAAIGVIIRTQGRAFQRYASEGATGPGIAQHLRSKSYVCGCLRIPSFWTGCDRRVSAKFYLAVQKAVYPAWVHNQNHEISCLTPDLEANATRFQSHHGRCAPWSGHFSARAADHSAAAVAASYDESSLYYGGENH